jgi:hypothetical protein
VSRFQPDQIRQTIAELVEKNQLELADALSNAGLSLYPQSEDILAISALLAEMQQDWLTAGNLLEQLIEVQDGRTPVTTWQHWIRVLRCQCEPIAALHAAECALMIYPETPVLLNEMNSLKALLSDSYAHEAAANTH